MIGQNLSPISGCNIQGLTWTSGIGTNNRYYFPAYGLYDYSVSMFIILASELDAGISCINGISYQVSGYSSPYTYYNQSIRLLHTQNSFFGTAVTVGLSNLTVSDDTTVKANFDYTITGSGWNDINFDDNFQWNGSDNILVIHENRDGNYSSGYGWGECLNQGAGINRSVYKYQDNSYPSDSTVMTVDNRRINMKLTY
jgi:hypothetical protein